MNGIHDILNDSLETDRRGEQTTSESISVVGTSDSELTRRLILRIMEAAVSVASANIPDSVVIFSQQMICLVPIGRMIGSTRTKGEPNDTTAARNIEHS